MFSSQYGTFSVDTLPVVSLGSDRAIVEPAAPSYEAQSLRPRPGSAGSLQSHEDILKALERHRRPTSEGHPFGRRVQIQKGRMVFAAMNHRFEERQIGDNELPKGCQ